MLNLSNHKPITRGMLNRMKCHFTLIGLAKLKDLIVSFCEDLKQGDPYRVVSNEVRRGNLEVIAS